MSTFRCSLTDIDNFLEMNNGRVFTLYDFGRTDFAIRSGLGKKLLENRWGLVVAGSTIQYRKRIRAFDLVTIKTRIAAPVGTFMIPRQNPFDNYNTLVWSAVGLQIKRDFNGRSKVFNAQG